MFRSCTTCKAVASPDLHLQYCAACQSALYCSEVCQKKDWRKQHKKICKHINVGHGGMQVRNDAHMLGSIESKERFERKERCQDKEDKRFFKLFEESSLEESRAAALEMKQIAERQTKHNQIFLLFYSLHFLLRSDLEMLSWPNSPLLVMLQFVDPNVLTGYEDEPLQEGETRQTPLHMLADLADSYNYSTHENQLILAKQLIEYGANVNAVARPHGETPLHTACFGGNVTNLDFIELLLKEGADPNFQDYMGLTPLICTNPYAPGAAKFLLNWRTTDANITARSEASFLARVIKTVVCFTENVARPGSPERVQNKFLLRQWSDIEEMLVERGAIDTGITSFE
jgi:hypothetical protein